MAQLVEKLVQIHLITRFKNKNHSKNIMALGNRHVSHDKRKKASLLNLRNCHLSTIILMCFFFSLPVLALLEAKMQRL